MASRLVRSTADVDHVGVDRSGDVSDATRPTRQPVAFELRPASPFRLDLTCWALRRRPRNRVDVWDGRYHRALSVGGRTVAVTVEQSGDAAHPRLSVRIAPPVPASGRTQETVRRHVGQLLGIDVDLGPFYALAERDPRLRPLRDRFLGVRPPRFPTVFEALVNAVANQQLSLEVGIELLNRFCEAFGARPPGHPDLPAFPAASTIAGSTAAELRALGFSGPKSGYLLDLAHRVATGEVDADELEAADRQDAVDRLTALRGIGRWSAEYVLLRGLGRLDVYPGDDVGARNKLRRLMDLDHPPTYDEIRRIVSPWQPYAGVVYFHLLLDGLARGGQLDP